MGWIHCVLLFNLLNHLEWIQIEIVIQSKKMKIKLREEKGGKKKDFQK